MADLRQAGVAICQLRACRILPAPNPNKKPIVALFAIFKYNLGFSGGLNPWI